MGGVLLRTRLNCATGKSGAYLDPSGFIIQRDVLGQLLRSVKYDDTAKSLPGRLQDLWGRPVPSTETKAPGAALAQRINLASGLHTLLALIAHGRPNRKRLPLRRLTHLCTGYLNPRPLTILRKQNSPSGLNLPQQTDPRKPAEICHSLDQSFSACGKFVASPGSHFGGH